MEIEKHVFFRVDEAPELLKYVFDNKLKNDYKEGDIAVSFDIYESSPHWVFISECVKKYNLRPQSQTIFSKTELANAQWLSMRSVWGNGYPQPESNFGYEKNITYSDEKLCSECGDGAVQIDSFRIKKLPNWGNRHFMMLNWVFDEIFVDDIAKEILQKEGISGISFLGVKDKKGIEFFENTNQVVIEKRLERGIVTEGISSIDDIYVCSKCGVPKYHPTGIGMLAFKKEIFDGAPDVVKTAEIFGWGHAAPTEIIVSQKVYQTIVKNKLERSLVFQPIELV